MSGSFPALDNEFAHLAGPAATAGGGQDAAPTVRRDWVSVPDCGQVSAVIWGSGPPEVVFLHEAGRSARAWDGVALALSRPAVAIDLPGHGHSGRRGPGWLRDGHYQPRKLAAPVAEAIRSLAPQASLVVGSGLGGQTALALITTPRPAFVRRLALIDTLPGAARRSGDGTGDPGSGDGTRDPGSGDITLWEELAGLQNPAFVIHGERSGRLTAADLAELEQRAPRVTVITIPGAADDMAGSQPDALAGWLGRLISAT
jgi:pimeloyl-ACP methyl ester carboxylesterase